MSKKWSIVKIKSWQRVLAIQKNVFYLKNLSKKGWIVLYTYNYYMYVKSIYVEVMNYLHKLSVCIFVVEPKSCFIELDKFSPRQNLMRSEEN